MLLVAILVIPNGTVSLTVLNKGSYREETPKAVAAAKAQPSTQEEFLGDLPRIP
jgi:hypothetical protein